MLATEVVATVWAADPDITFVASLGTATSAVRAVTNDGPHLCIAGAMGCALAVAIGLAESTTREIVAILGDGELAMGAGSLWTLAALRPANLRVVVLADGKYSITGGQNLGINLQAAAVAAILGLRSAKVETESALSREFFGIGRPALIEAVVTHHIWPGPSAFVDPNAVRIRLADALRAHQAAYGGSA